MKHRPVALCLAISLLLVACKGDAGPTGPEGPPGVVGPQGPGGPAVSYVVFVGAITTTPMTTATQQTGGVPPGVVCYLNDTAVPEVWIVLALDSTDGSGCAIVEDGTGYYGSAVLPASVINAGFNIRIILFWVV